MPVRNAGRYLRTAVQSILDQHAVHLELIIIDDHSTDGAIGELPADPRISITSAHSPGIVSALNTGLALARFPYIARMDGDDLAHPDRLSSQLNLIIENPELDIVGAKVQLFKQGSSIARGYSLYQTWINALTDHKSITSNLFIESPIPHPTAFMRRATLIKLGGYVDNGWPEDYDLWCRAFLAGCRFAKPSHEVLLQWRDYEQRTSRVDRRYQKDRFIDCKAFYLSAFLRKQGLHACSIWGAGPTGLKLHDALVEQGITTTGFIDVNPKLLGRTKRDKPIHIVDSDHSVNAINTGEAPCLVAVAARGAREKIFSALTRVGKQNMRDFILAA